MRRLLHRSSPFDEGTIIAHGASPRRADDRLEGAALRFGCVVRLQHVSTPYPPGRAEELRSFYGGVLGLEEKDVPESLAGRGLVWFSAGDGERELHFLPEQDADRRSMRHFCLEVDDVEATRRTIAAAGWQTLDETPIPNRPRFFCRDPFGNLIEITTIRGDYRE